MQTIHWVITGCLALIGIGAYIFKAGQWTSRVDMMDQKSRDVKEEIYKEIDRRCKELEKRDDGFERRLARIEEHRRVLVFPRGRERMRANDEEGEEN
jgi:hypothetical protein